MVQWSLRSAAGSKMAPHFASEESNAANAFEPSIACLKKSVLNSVISIIESLIIANDFDEADAKFCDGVPRRPNSHAYRMSTISVLCCIDLASQYVIGRPILDLVAILATPSYHLGETFVPANLRLPADGFSNRGGIQPIAGVLAESIAGYGAKVFEWYA